LELKCKGGAVPAHFPLYGEFHGKIYPAAQNKENPAQYQISISEETKRFPSASSVKVFDEENFQLARKSDAAKPLITLPHNVRHGYSGPSVNSELFVVFFAATAFYLAHGIKSRMYEKN